MSIGALPPECSSAAVGSASLGSSYQKAAFRSRLLAWHAANRRELPWREPAENGGRDPYRVWLAEIMLQQTRIAVVKPYYERFVRRCPTVQSLARASEQEVLALWSGLGYYARARCLHRAAQAICEKHGGRFPHDLAAARDLPGVGAYTAAAVLSIAYGQPLAVLDGNVARVLARLGAMRGDLRQPRRWHLLGTLAQILLPPRAAGEWNEALMDLGQTICRQTPQCARCPVARWCGGRALGLAGQIPAPRRKRSPQRVTIAAGILCDSRARTLLLHGSRRGDDDGAMREHRALFSRLWHFPGVAISASKGAGAELNALLRRIGVRPRTLLALAAVRHTVTFRRITFLPFLVRAGTLPRIPGGRRVRLDRICLLPASSATRKLASAAMEAIQGEARAAAGKRRRPK